MSRTRNDFCSYARKTGVFRVSFDEQEEEPGEAMLDLAYAD